MRKRSWQNDLKGVMLAIMMVGFTAMLPQLIIEEGGILFSMVWSVMVMLGAAAVYRVRRLEQAETRRRHVLSFKKKLRTSPEKVRSRITVRLKA